MDASRTTRRLVIALIVILVLLYTYWLSYTAIGDQDSEAWHAHRVLPAGCVHRRYNGSWLCVMFRPAAQLEAEMTGRPVLLWSVGGADRWHLPVVVDVAGGMYIPSEAAR